MVQNCRISLLCSVQCRKGPPLVDLRRRIAECHCFAVYSVRKDPLVDLRHRTAEPHSCAVYSVGKDPHCLAGLKVQNCRISLFCSVQCRKGLPGELEVQNCRIYTIV